MNFSMYYAHLIHRECREPCIMLHTFNSSQRCRAGAAGWSLHNTQAASSEMPPYRRQTSGKTQAMSLSCRLQGVEVEQAALVCCYKRSRQPWAHARLLAARYLPCLLGRQQGDMQPSS